MRRAGAVAALAAGIGLVVGGCGVQSTGVKVSSAVPFSGSESSSSQNAPTAEKAYSVPLFLFSATNKGYGTMIIRQVATAPGPGDLANLLSEAPPQDTESDYTTYVPPGIVVKKSQQAAHLYYLNMDLTPLALTQLECTFAQYWSDHPDPNPEVGPSTRFVMPHGDTNWQDCPSGVLSKYDRTTPPANKPTGAVPSAFPSLTGR